MTQPQAPPPAFTDRYKAVVLSLLVLAYTFNFIDRTIISIIGQAIKVDLKLTDTQLGLLGGVAFALLYTTLGIPIARLAERKSRVNIMAVSIVIWSAFTAACGMAQNFIHLLILRVGVGVGEAGLSPPAHSLISDYFEPRKRATALSVYSFGIPLGAMLGAALGGWLTQAFSWRVAFVVVGLPGILVAVALKLIVKEPPRGHSEPVKPPPAAGPEDVTDAAAPATSFWRHEFRELAAVAATLFHRWPIFNMVAGCTIATFAGYGAAAFLPPYFLRVFGLDYTQVGLIIGLISGLSAGAGMLLGGWLTDRLAPRGPRWYALVPAIGLTVSAPLYILGLIQPTWLLAMVILLIPGVFHYTYLAPMLGVVQNMVTTRRRATASAILLFTLNLIGLGGGPVFTGWLIDHFSNVDLAAFSTLCPGGVAPAGASAESAAQCTSTLAEATRSGLIVTVCLYVWAGLHYLLGSIGLTKALSEARVERGEAA